MEVFIPYINNTNLIKNVADIFIFEKILESKLKILFYGNYFSINIFSSTLNNNNKLKIRSSNNFFNNNFKYI